jgi:hypothetical protein
LTSIREHLQRDYRSEPRSIWPAVVVCLVLIALLAMAQITHVHAVDGDADHCPLCIAMHSVVPFVALVVAVVLVRISSTAPPLREISAIVRYWHPALFVRPPLAAC